MICSRARNLKILSKFLFWSPQTTTTTLCSLEKHKSAFWKDFVSKVLYICVNCWRLAHKHVIYLKLRQKNTQDKSWASSQTCNYFHSKWCLFVFKPNHFGWKNKFAQLVFNSNYFWFQLEINHVIHEPTAKKFSQM